MSLTDRGYCTGRCRGVRFSEQESQRMATVSEEKKVYDGMVRCLRMSNSCLGEEVCKALVNHKSIDML